MIDATIRTFYRAAHVTRTCLSFVREPSTRSARAAVWHGDRLLLVYRSYGHRYTLPGESLRAGESPDRIASRALERTCGIQLPPSQFELSMQSPAHLENRIDTFYVCETNVVEEPRVHINRWRIFGARFYSIEYAQKLDLVPQLHTYLSRRQVLS
ncbi:MAG: NUDIX hydrolase [Myxococcota bacterium]